jgi:hypothetical protein
MITNETFIILLAPPISFILNLSNNPVSPHFKDKASESQQTADTWQLAQAKDLAQVGSSAPGGSSWWAGNQCGIAV